jgi:hypothetical protein
MRDRFSGGIEAKPRIDFIDFGMGSILALLQRLAIFQAQFTGAVALRFRRSPNG